MNFEKILFVVIENNVSELALSEAVSLAKKLEADFNILCVLPEFGKKHQDLEDAYREKISQTIFEILEKMDISGQTATDHIQFTSGKPYTKTVVDHLQQNRYDLVIKLSEDVNKKGKSGYGSLDISLIRKSPTPVFFINHEVGHTDKRQIFVAIDPVTSVQQVEELNKTLLKTADNMASYYGDTIIEVLSCWRFEHETFMRDSVFSGQSEEEIDALVEDERKAHEDALNALLDSVQLDNAHQVHIFKGRADEVIPNFMKDHDDDLLLMGTIGRVGLSGFFLGNTAENIFNALDSSLLTIKPSE